MPGTHSDWDKLEDFSIATNQKMGRDFNAFERTKTGVCIEIELIKK